MVSSTRKQRKMQSTVTSNSTMNIDATTYDRQKIACAKIGTELSQVAWLRRRVESNRNNLVQEQSSQRLKQAIHEEVA